MGSKMSAGACAGAEKDKVLREAFLSLVVVARDALLYLVTLSDLLRLTFCRTGLAPISYDSLSVVLDWAAGGRLLRCRLLSR